MNELSRRSFTESLALAALAPLIGVRPETIRLPGWSDAASPTVMADPGALAQALAEIIRHQYGSRLSTSDLTAITVQIQAGLERADELRAVNLANGDEPDVVFAAGRRSPPPR
ncbi:MAG TPA: hypothetical protein VFS51_07740 [Gemmatimonadales bacterium]|nr:hypothetical protein [Gemmatimonadales bacterium]